MKKIVLSLILVILIFFVFNNVSALEEKIEIEKPGIGSIDKFEIGRIGFGDKHVLPGKKLFKSG
ncbi:MAG: hypothetical protein ABH821_00300 [archaeon]